MTEAKAAATRRFRLLPEDNFLGWTPYVWLVYVPTMFLTPAIRNDPPYVWWITGAVSLVFLPLYFRGYWARGREFYIVIAAISALGIGLATINNSGFALFIYAAAFAGTRRPTRLALSLLAIITAIILLEGLLLGLPVFAWGWSILFVWIVGGTNTHYSTVRQSDIMLRRARDEIEHLATVAERERIARDLHDLLGHTLSLITLKASLASRLADRDPAKAAEEIRDVERISRQALSEVRAAVAGFRDAGLAREVANAGSMLEAAGIKARMEIGQVSLSATEVAVLALAIREGVTNVVRHSRAAVCSIKVHDTGTGRVLEISDTGSWKRAPFGNGLTGMRERIEAIGGTLRVTSDAGTKLVVELPAVQGSQSRQATNAHPLHVVA